MCIDHNSQYVCSIISPFKELLIGAFVKFRKADINFVTYVSLSVCPSVHTNQLLSHQTNFHDTQYFSMFRKSIEEIRGSLKSQKRITSTVELHLSGLIGMRRHPDMQNIKMNSFFENRPHWQCKVERNFYKRLF